MCDSVAVMYLGRIVEHASVDDLFYDSKHPYTSALLRSIPRLGVRTVEKLQVIRGSVPDPYTVVPGCPFHLRCDSHMPGTCDQEMPPETQIGPHHMVRCFLYS
jgi:peptide/nickel transport system ATP-binding protein